MFNEGEFKNIDEVGCLYSVNYLGEVKHNRLNRKIKLQYDRGGYCYFSMQTPWGKEKKMKQHRLIMIYFGPECDGVRVYVNHKDGDRKNNSLSNLEWCTPKENSTHCYKRIGHMPPSRKGVFGKDNIQSRKVKATNVKTGEVLFFDGCSDAERKSNGKFWHQQISKCARGINKTHKGYVWEYI